MGMQQRDIEVRVSRLPEGAKFEMHVRGGESPESRTIVEDLDCLPSVVRNRITKTSEVAVKVYLSSCGLKRVPSWVFGLPRLTWLDLSNNQLTALPSEIGRLTNLTRLDLARNQLTGLPLEIGELKKLTELYLAWNQLTDVLPGIRELKKLKKLDLSWNQLTSVPPWIGELTELTDLFVSGCGGFGGWWR